MIVSNPRGLFVTAFAAAANRIHAIWVSVSSSCVDRYADFVGESAAYTLVDMTRQILTVGGPYLLGILRVVISVSAGLPIAVRGISSGEDCTQLLFDPLRIVHPTGRRGRHPGAIKSTSDASGAPC